MNEPLTKEQEVENELLLDRLIFGTSWYRVVDGNKVRIDPREVYLRPRWWERVWDWLRWNLWRRWR